MKKRITQNIDHKKTFSQKKGIHGRPPFLDTSKRAGFTFKLTPYDFDKLVSYKSPKFPTDKPFNIPRPI